MKKLLAVLLIALTAFTCLAACGTSAEAENDTTASAVANLTDTVSESDKSVFDTTHEGFRVVTVGTGNPVLDENAGGASTLIQYQDKYFLVDCGWNSVNTLLENGLNVSEITNMLFTHQHNDHNADFWSFFVSGWSSPTGRRSLNLIGPSVQELYDLTIDFYGQDLEYRSNGVGFSSDGVLTNVNIYDFTEDEESIELDGVTITAMKVPHTIETYAYKFEAGGETVVISGDMTYVDGFSEFAKDADILVMDGMMTGEFADVPEEARAGLIAGLSKAHILSDEIGQIAAESGATTLILTHLSDGSEMSKKYKTSIAESYEEMGYEGEVVFAYDGMSIEP